jgi:RNA polymerase-binding transcription factor DksA
LIAAFRKGCAHEDITIAFCGSPCRSRGEGRAHEAARERGVSAGNPKALEMALRDARPLRDRLIEERSEALSEAAEPVERHSLHRADSATDEFDHELALSQLSGEQDALYEVEAAMRRILDSSYGVCERTGKRIPAARLKAVPWTRFREEVQARLESTGEITPRHLGTLRSVRNEPAAAFAESEPTVEEPEPASPSEQSTEDNAHALAEEEPTRAARPFQNERTIKPS